MLTKLHFEFNLWIESFVSFRSIMPSEGKVFKLTEVAEHNKSKGDNKSIWIVIHDKVYDVTKFMDEVLI